MSSIQTGIWFAGGRGNGTLFFSEVSLARDIDSRIIVESLIEQKVGVPGL